MLPATIATSVAPETITRVSRLFNGTAGDILSELLQNARRAAASRVAIDLSGTPGARVLTITDDGSGIADPASVVTLGRSGWSSETVSREDPAGMGVFSLAGRDVVIRSWSASESRGWRATIPAEAWDTSRPIAIEADDIEGGTAISFTIPGDWERNLDRTIEAAALFYPLPVLRDGVELPRKGWLDGACHVEEWGGCRIGVFTDLRDDYPVSSSIRINFHGLVVKCDMPEISEVDRGRKWTVRIDIVDAPAIKLVLPARKEAVENDALAALRNEARAVIFRAIAGVGEHRLSFETWSRARETGIDLPEAAPYLFSWVAPCADSRENYLTGTKTSGADMVLVPEIAAIVAQPMRRVLDAGASLGGILVEEQPRFAGYAWYDVLARITDVRFRIERDGQSFEVGDVEEAPAETEDGFVDSVLLLATVERDGRTQQIQRDADVAFSPDTFSCDDIDEIGIFVRRGADLAAIELAELLEVAIFDPSDDSDADTRETQAERFRRDAQQKAVRLIDGNDAAIAAELRSLLQSHAWIVPGDRTVSISVTRETLDVTVAPRNTEATV